MQTPSKEGKKWTVGFLGKEELRELLLTVLTVFGQYTSVKSGIVYVAEGKKLAGHLAWYEHLQDFHVLVLGPP